MKDLTQWLDWGDEAFARARAEAKPVLLSLTARWCHACHRMDEETWDDPAVAAAVTRATIPVRVDADARPDVYGRYHLGGLPTTALLTPDGDFIRGGTFLSPPQLFAFLETALDDFTSGRRPSRRPAVSAPPPANLVEDATARLLRQVDAEHGGFGVAPKQPQPRALLLLLRQWRVSRDAALEATIRAALDAIVAHLDDPRDGGFFRYAAAADWTAAHTEKVALDQAQLIWLMLEAGSALAEPRYIDSARQGLAHARRRLADRDGRVFASIAADPEYYAGARAADELPTVDERRFADSSAAMVAAGWLAFAITGEASSFRAEFRQAAPDGRVPHDLTALEGHTGSGVSGLLMDQALALAATLIEYRLTGAPDLLDWATRAGDWSIAHLWDERAEAFKSAPDDRVPGDGAGAPQKDRAPQLPPMFPLVANGEMALALIDLAAHAGRPEYARCAERLVQSLSPQASPSPAGPALALAAQRLQTAAAEADIEASPADASARDLARVVIAAFGPSAVIRWSHGAGRSITLCVRDLCLPSIENARELAETLVDLDLTSHEILAPGGILASARESARGNDQEGL